MCCVISRAKEPLQDCLGYTTAPRRKPHQVQVCRISIPSISLHETLSGKSVPSNPSCCCCCWKFMILPTWHATIAISLAGFLAFLQDLSILLDSSAVTEAAAEEAPGMERAVVIPQTRSESAPLQGLCWYFSSCPTEEMKAHFWGEDKNPCLSLHHWWGWNPGIWGSPCPAFLVTMVSKCVHPELLTRCLQHQQPHQLRICRGKQGLNTFH